MKRVYLAPNHLPKDHEAFLAACSREEAIVHKMAIKNLASSYFMEKCHGYISWKKKIQEAKEQSSPVK